MREYELEALERGAGELGIPLSKAQKEMFQIYFHELLEWNRRVNLISKADEKRIVERHFLDSLTCFPYLPFQKGLRVIDVGAGAGFPGLPLKIARDDLVLKLVESKRRKVLFLRHLIARLKLTQVEAILGRVEEIGSEFDSFDVVLSRGVARLPRLLQISFPLLKKGGTLIAYKGKEVEEEVLEALPVLERIGGGGIELKEVVPSLTGGGSKLVLVRK